MSEIQLIYKWLDEYENNIGLISKYEGLYTVSAVVKKVNIETEGATIGDAIRLFYEQLESEEQ